MAVLQLAINNTDTSKSAGLIGKIAPKKLQVCLGYTHPDFEFIKVFVNLHRSVIDNG